MIKIENVVLASPEQMEFIIQGMRNPMNSWEKSDSAFGRNLAIPYTQNNPIILFDKYGVETYIGDNDLDLMKRLSKAGTEHRKYMRMMPVYARITAPLYWWKEFDTYKVGTVANSCSTMHKIQAKEFTLEDFSCEHLYVEDDIGGMYYSQTAEEEFTSTDVLKVIIEALNNYRTMFLETKDKSYWWQMIQLLPSSYNQTRNVMLNYEVLANMYGRKDHKLDCWREFCKWIESLPYSELITGKENTK